MAIKEWVLTDHSCGLWVENLNLDENDIGIPNCRVNKRQLQGGLSEGVDIVEIKSGETELVVVPTRGMSIRKAAYRGKQLGWKSPVRGPVHPQFIIPSERGGLGWLRGFDEWIVRCGLDYNGAPGVDTVLDNNGNTVTVQLDLHGKIANIPAHYVKLIADTEREILQIQGIVDESALFHPSLSLKTSITVSPHSSRITVADTIVNNQSTSAELELLYHCNFGPPFMNENSRIVLPFHSIAPRDQRACENIGNTKEEALTKITSCPGPTKGYIEQVYFCKPASLPDDSATLAALVNSKAEHAAVIRYNSAQLPCLTLWKNTASENEGYVVGIEPATDYPNCRPVEREAGRVISLSPGESYTTQLMFEIAEGEEAVTNVLAEIAQIQDEASGEINLTPIE